MCGRSHRSKRSTAKRPYVCILAHSTRDFSPPPPIISPPLHPLPQTPIDLSMLSTDTGPHCASGVEKKLKAGQSKHRRPFQLTSHSHGQVGWLLQVLAVLIAIPGLSSAEGRLMSVHRLFFCQCFVVKTEQIRELNCLRRSEECAMYIMSSSPWSWFWLAGKLLRKAREYIWCMVLNGHKNHTAYWALILRTAVVGVLYFCWPCSIRSKCLNYNVLT